jgi:hypothetical protein
MDFKKNIVKLGLLLGCWQGMAFGVTQTEIQNLFTDLMPMLYPNPTCKFSVPDPENPNKGNEDPDHPDRFKVFLPLRQNFSCDQSKWGDYLTQISNRFTTGDYILFTGLMCYTDLTVNLTDNTQNPSTDMCDNIYFSQVKSPKVKSTDMALYPNAKSNKNDKLETAILGRFYRSPLLKPDDGANGTYPTYGGDYNNSFSRDHILGILLYLLHDYKNNGDKLTSKGNTVAQNLATYLNHSSHNYTDTSSILNKVTHMCPVPYHSFNAEETEDQSNTPDYCTIQVPLNGGIIDIIKKVYTYIGLDASVSKITSYNYSSKSYFNNLVTGCAAKPLFCHLAASAYLIESSINDIAFLNDSTVKQNQQTLFKSSNPFQKYAVSAQSKIDWQDLANKTYKICNYFVRDKDWPTLAKRENWLWEQNNACFTNDSTKNSILCPKQKNFTQFTPWGWDCAMMLNIILKNWK